MAGKMPAMLRTRAALILALSLPALPARAQCPQVLPCDPITADNAVCVQSAYHFHELPSDNAVLEEDQVTTSLAPSALARAPSSSRASAGYSA
jgi:hypothetical protein